MWLLEAGSDSKRSAWYIRHVLVARQLKLDASRRARFKIEHEVMFLIVIAVVPLLRLRPLRMQRDAVDARRRCQRLAVGLNDL